MDDKSAGVAAGVVVGVFADVMWKAWPPHIYLAEERSPLAFIDHIHLGLVSLIAEKKVKLGGVGLGLGASFIALEFTYPDHFTRDSAEAAKSNALTALLTLLYIFS